MDNYNEIKGQVENAQNVLCHDSAFANEGIYLQKRENRQLLLSLLVLVCEELEFGAEPAKKLRESAENRKLGPYQGFDFINHFLQSNPWRQAFNQLYRCYKSLPAEDACFAWLHLNAPSVVSLYSMLTHLRKTLNNDLLCAIHIFLLLTADYEAPIKTKRKSEYDSYSRKFQVQPLANASQLTFLFKCIRHLHVPEPSSRSKQGIGKLKEKHRLNSLECAVDFYDGLSTTKENNEDRLLLQKMGLLDNPYAFLSAVGLTHMREKLDTSLVLNALLRHIHANTTNAIVLVDPGFQLADIWSHIAPIPTTYLWSQPKVMKCMNAKFNANISNVSVADFKAKTTPAHFDLAFILAFESTDVLALPPSGVAYAVIGEQSIEKMLESSVVGEISIFPTELVTAKRQKTPATPQVLVQYVSADAESNSEVVLQQFYRHKAEKGIDIGAPDAKNDNSAKEELESYFLEPTKPTRMIRTELLSQLSFKSIRSIHRNRLALLANGKRLAPQEITFSNEITVFYTKTYLKKQDIHRYYVYLRERATQKQIRRNKSFFGNKIASSAFTCNFDTHDEDVVKDKILAEFLERAKTAPVSSDDIMGNYPISDASLKSFWYCNLPLLLKNMHYRHSVAQWLFMFQSSLGDCMLTGTRFEKYVEAFEQTFPQIGLMDGCPPKEELKSQMEIILGMALTRKAIRKEKIAPDCKDLSEFERSAMRQENRQFLQEFSRGFSGYYGLDDRKRTSEVRAALTKRTWSLEEEQHIVQMAQDDESVIPGWVRMGILLRLFTGLGPPEICALTWEDYKPKHGHRVAALHISKQIEDRTKTDAGPLSKKEKYRIIPLVEQLDGMLKRKKKEVEKGLTSKPKIGQLPIISVDESKWQTACTPKNFSKQVFATLYDVLHIPNEERYNTDIFNTNFRYKAINYSDMNQGEVNYLLGYVAPDTFSKHYCDYTNVSAQTMLKQKLERWAARYKEYPGTPHITKPSLFFSENQEEIIVIKPFQATPAAASITLYVDQVQMAGERFTLHLSSEHGLRGTITLVEGIESE